MMKMPGMYSCREIHEHASMGTDDDLGMFARMKFAMHLLMCVHCARYVRQLKALGEYARRVLGGQPEPERCERIEKVVMASCDGHGH